MYRIGVDLGGTNISVGVVDNAVEAASPHNSDVSPFFTLSDAVAEEPVDALTTTFLIVTSLKPFFKYCSTFSPFAEEKK